ncbi:MAG: hypothetical protein ACI8PT_001664, partial [Gammaproteobacteria bacterium]
QGEIFVEIRFKKSDENLPFTHLPLVGQCTLTLSRAYTTDSSAADIRGQLVVDSTTTDIRRAPRWC